MGLSFLSRASIFRRYAGRMRWVGGPHLPTKRRGKVRCGYYLSRLRRNGKQFSNAVRDRWGIENTLNWSLDMTYREDESRVRNRNFAQNLTWLRRLTLSLIKQHPGKESYVMERRLLDANPYRTIHLVCAGPGSHPRIEWCVRFEVGGHDRDLTRE